MRVGKSEDAAALLRVHVNRIYEMAQAGELPQLRRVGPELRFDMDVLEAWMRGEVDLAPVRTGAEPVTPSLQQCLDEALDLARRAQRERAIACSNLTLAQGELREAQIELEVCELSLRNALLELCVARELLSYHGLTVVA